MKISIQMNGADFGNVIVPFDSNLNTVLDAIKKIESVDPRYPKPLTSAIQKAVKMIFVPNKLINFVMKNNKGTDNEN